MADDKTKLTAEELEMYKQFRQQLREQQDEAKKNLERVADTLFPLLARLGVLTMTVECEGGGDQGEIVSIDLKMGAGQTAPSLAETECDGKPIREVIEEAVYLTLFIEHPGWELNAGSDSTYVFDVPNRKVLCERFLALEEADSDEDEGVEDGDVEEEDDEADNEDE